MTEEHLQAEIQAMRRRISECLRFIQRQNPNVDLTGDYVSLVLADHLVRNRAVPVCANTERLVKVLRSIEWAGATAFPLCPWCYGTRERHKGGCELQAALKLAKGK